MIALPEGINLQGQGSEEEKLAELQKYVRYMTERMNNAILELSDRVQLLEEGGNSNGN